MFFLADPSVDVIYYKIALFGALMVMAYFEAWFYTRENILPNKRVFYRISFASNTIVGLFLFLPVYEFDLITIGVYLIRTIIIRHFYVIHNHKKTPQQANVSFLFLFFKVLLVFVAYNFVFFLGSLVVGLILHLTIT
jgi:hypothetical protein